MNMKIAAESIISALKLLMLMYFDKIICINRWFSCFCGPALRTSVRVANRRLLGRHQMVGIVYGLLCACARYNVGVYAKRDGSCTAFDDSIPADISAHTGEEIFRRVRCTSALFCRSLGHL